MNDPKVLLIFCNWEGPSTPALGITSIATHLMSHGYEVEIFDDAPYMMDRMNESTDPRERNMNVIPTDHSHLYTLPYENKMHDFQMLLECFRPSIIGISASRYGFLNGVEYLEIAKQYDNRIYTMVGGAFAMSKPETVIGYDCVDMVALGDGEHVCEELCDKLKRGQKIDDIEGLWVKDDHGNLQKNGYRSLFNPNDLPSLRFDLFNEKRLYRPIGGKIRRCIPLEISRGCPYQCNNCSVPLFAKRHRNSGKWFRIKSVQKIEEDIKHYIREYDPEYFFFMSPTFLGFPKEYTADFINMYSKYKIPFYMFTRPERIEKKTIERLLDIGLDRMSVGIECGNEDYRKNMLNRKYSDQLIKDKFQILNQLSITVSTNVIIGLPDETEEMIIETIRLIKAVKSDNVSVTVSIYQAYENTPLYDYCIDNGYYEKDYISDTSVFSTNIKNPYLSEEKIMKYFHLFNLYVSLEESQWPLLEHVDIANREERKALQKLVESSQCNRTGSVSLLDKLDEYQPSELYEKIEKSREATPYGHC